MATTALKNSSSGRSGEALRRIHQNWMRRYDRNYADEEEEEQRFKLFKATFEEIEKHNTEEETCLIYLSPYSDLTDEEFFAFRSNLQGELREEMLDDISIRDFMRPKACDACRRRLCCSE